MTRDWICDKRNVSYSLFWAILKFLLLFASIEIHFHNTWTSQFGVWHSHICSPGKKCNSNNNEEQLKCATVCLTPSCVVFSEVFSWHPVVYITTRANRGLSPKSPRLTDGKTPAVLNGIDWGQCCWKLCVHYLPLCLLIHIYTGIQSNVAHAGLAPVASRYLHTWVS